LLQNKQKWNAWRAGTLIILFEYFANSGKKKVHDLGGCEPLAKEILDFLAIDLISPPVLCWQQKY